MLDFVVIASSSLLQLYVFVYVLDNVVIDCGRHDHTVYRSCASSSQNSFVVVDSVFLN